MIPTTPPLYTYLSPKDIASLQSTSAELNEKIGSEIIYAHAISRGFPWWLEMTVEDLNVYTEMDLPELLKVAGEFSDRRVIDYWLDDVQLDDVDLYNIDRDIYDGILAATGGALSVGDIELYNYMMTKFSAYIKVDENIGPFYTEAVESRDWDIIVKYVDQAVTSYTPPTERSFGYDMLSPMLIAAVEVADMELIDHILEAGSGVMWNIVSDDEDVWARDIYEDGEIIHTEIWTQIVPFPYKEIFDVAYSCATFEDSNKPIGIYADIITKIISYNQEDMRHERDELRSGYWYKRRDAFITSRKEYADHPDFAYEDITVDGSTIRQVIKRNNAAALQRIGPLLYTYTNLLTLAISNNNIDMAKQFVDMGMIIKSFNGGSMAHITPQTLDYIINVIGARIYECEFDVRISRDPNVMRIMVSNSVFTCDQWIGVSKRWLQVYDSISGMSWIIILRYLIEECNTNLVDRVIRVLRNTRLYMRANRVAKYFNVD